MELWGQKQLQSLRIKIILLISVGTKLTLADTFSKNVATIFLEYKIII